MRKTVLLMLTLALVCAGAIAAAAMGATPKNVAIALHKRMSELVGIAPLFYGVGVILARSSVQGPVGEVAEKSGMAWNVFEWEISR